MCFKSPTIQTPAAVPVPRVDTNNSVIADARLRAGRLLGPARTIFTTPLGDPGYGSSTRSKQLQSGSAVLLGQTAGAAS